MIRIVIVLFWVSLLIGTLLAHNLVANWAVTLAGLYFLVRWWTVRNRESRTAKNTGRSMTVTVRPDRTSPPPVSDPVSAAVPRHSRWTVDGVHATEHRWR